MFAALIYTCSVCRSVMVFSGAMNVIMEFPNEGMQLLVSWQNGCRVSRVIVNCTHVCIQTCNYSSRFTAVACNNLASHVMVMSANNL